MNPVLDEIVRTGRVEKPSGETVALRSSVSPGEGAFLQRLVGPLQALLEPEWVPSDPPLGIPHGATRLALEKTRDDDRSRDHRHEF